MQNLRSQRQRRQCYLLICVPVPTGDWGYLEQNVVSCNDEPSPYLIDFQNLGDINLEHCAGRRARPTTPKTVPSKCGTGPPKQSCTPPRDARFPAMTVTTSRRCRITQPPPETSRAPPPANPPSLIARFNYRPRCHPIAVSKRHLELPPPSRQTRTPQPTTVLSSSRPYDRPAPVGTGLSS